MSTQDLPHREPPPRNYNSTLGVHNFTLKYNHLYSRGKAQSQNNNHLYTRGMGTRLNNNHLYTKRDKGSKPNSTTITSTQEG